MLHIAFKLALTLSMKFPAISLLHHVLVKTGLGVRRSLLLSPMEWEGLCLIIALLVSKAPSIYSWFFQTNRSGWFMNSLKSIYQSNLCFLFDWQIAFSHLFLLFPSHFMCIKILNISTCSGMINEHSCKCKFKDYFAMLMKQILWKL